MLQRVGQTLKILPQSIYLYPGKRLFCTQPTLMAPTPVPLPRHICDALGLSKDESAFREGSATIVLPSKEAAFLNPVQEFNRDLSVLAIRSWSEQRNEEKRRKFDASAAKRHSKIKKRNNRARNCNEETLVQNKKARIEQSQVVDRPTTANRTDKDGEKSDEGLKPSPIVQSQETEFRDYRFSILEALSATGLRSIRYAREIPLLRYVMANDLSSTAVDAMRRNVALNFPAGKDIAPWIPPLTKVSADDDKVSQKVESSLAKEVVADLENGIKEFQGTNNGRAQDQDSGLKSASDIHPECKVRLNEGDAISLMYNHREDRKKFDVVDLDPYGSAAMFLDGAVQSVADGGLLCVTCTDSAVLSGTSYPEKAYSNYGGVTTKVEYSHEFALRLVLHAISTSAARYGRYVEPMLSLSIDFYVRLFVRVWTRPVEVKKLASHTGVVFTCSGCQYHSTLPFGRYSTNETKSGQTMDKFQPGSGPSVGPSCPECGHRFHTAGPMWLGRLHDPGFCKRMLGILDREEQESIAQNVGSRFGTAARIKGMVGVAAEELEGDKAPFYFTPSRISSFFHTNSPPLHTIVSALLHAGYSVSRAHATPGSLKTTAHRETLYDLWRAWIQRNPVKFESLSERSPTRALLLKDSSVEESAQISPPKYPWNLDEEHPDTKKVLEGQVSGQGTRYQVNPLPNWGPGTAAKSTPRVKS